MGMTFQTPEVRSDVVLMEPPVLQPKGPLDDVTQAWPEEIRMSEAVRERVTRRWKEYGL